MDSDARQTLLRTVYTCQSCPEGFGFTRPVPGQPYYKFPPTIGATGQAELLFVGINPRRAGNEALHDALMANIGAFEGLARNWDGRQRYIAAGGPEAHYQSHVEVVEGVYGRGARFEDHAAVTELFFCASADSAGLPPVRSECADRYFKTVLRLVAPRVVICVGARVFKYFRDRYGGGGGAMSVRFDQVEAALVRMPHPNARMSDQEREREIGAAIVEIRAMLSRATE